MRQLVINTLISSTLFLPSLLIARNNDAPSIFETKAFFSGDTNQFMKQFIISKNSGDLGVITAASLDQIDLTNLTVRWLPNEGFEIYQPNPEAKITITTETYHNGIQVKVANGYLEQDAYSKSCTTCEFQSLTHWQQGPSESETIYQWSHKLKIVQQLHGSATYTLLFLLP